MKWKNESMVGVPGRVSARLLLDPQTVLADPSSAPVSANTHPSEPWSQTLKTHVRTKVLVDSPTVLLFIHALTHSLNDLGARTCIKLYPSTHPDTQTFPDSPMHLHSLFHSMGKISYLKYFDSGVGASAPDQPQGGEMSCHQNQFRNDII